ncbi:unnamed protein product [Brassica rapa]|uniref:Secreted protein n=1 Tax=Brassica campestris TaxID=3711 RepID=A0A8D9D5N1_BRACM|nr:unnamed protein product [Brassica rapa]
MMLLFLMGRLLWRFLRLLSQTTWVTQSRYCFALSFSQYVYSTLVSLSDFSSCLFTGNHISGILLTNSRRISLVGTLFGDLVDHTMLLPASFHFVLLSRWTWYSSLLTSHADRVLSVASSAFRGSGVCYLSYTKLS